MLIGAKRFVLLKEIVWTRFWGAAAWSAGRSVRMAAARPPVPVAPACLVRVTLGAAQPVQPVLLKRLLRNLFSLCSQPRFYDARSLRQSDEGKRV